MQFCATFTILFEQFEITTVLLILSCQACFRDEEAEIKKPIKIVKRLNKELKNLVVDFLNDIFSPFKFVTFSFKILLPIDAFFGEDSNKAKYNQVKMILKITSIGLSLAFGIIEK